MTFCESLTWWNLWIVLAFSVLAGIVTLAAAYYILFKLSAKERPLFVTYQTLLLICFSIPSMIYYSLLISKYPAGQTWLQNILPTIADLCFILHDWIFTEEFLSASLRMPIAISMFKGKGEEQELKTQEK